MNDCLSLGFMSIRKLSPSALDGGVVGQSWSSSRKRRKKIFLQVGGFDSGKGLQSLL